MIILLRVTYFKARLKKKAKIYKKVLIAMIKV